MEKRAKIQMGGKSEDKIVEWWGLEFKVSLLSAVAAKFEFRLLWIFFLRGVRVLFFATKFWIRTLLYLGFPCKGTNIILIKLNRILIYFVDYTVSSVIPFIHYALKKLVKQ